MDEMGHTDPALALRVYRQAMRRGDDERAALRGLVTGEFRQRKGNNGGSEADETAESTPAGRPETADLQAI
jgi:hypothetical protein